MLDFKVYYDDGDYCGTSKVYAIDNNRDRFLIVNVHDKFIWVDTRDCTLEKEKKKMNVERYQAVHDELWKLKTQALNFNDEKTGIVVSRLCSIMQEILADIPKERDDNNDQI